MRKSGEDLFSAANSSEMWEYLLESEAVLIRILTGASILDKHKVETETSSLTHGGFHTRVCHDPGQHDRFNTSRLELLLQVGPGKCAPMSLRDQNIPRLEACGSSDLLGNGGNWLVAHALRLISNHVPEVVEVHAHVNNGGSLVSKRVG